eukprot:8853985-Karenia_brevis.AAC.1
MGHAVYRSWCDICVRARAKEWDCRRNDGKERKLPEYVWDYCFPGDEMGYTWTVLVGKEENWSYNGNPLCHKRGEEACLL